MLQENVVVSFAVLGMLCLLVYSAVLVAYRLVFSPLGGFAGSKITAATHYYEFYFNWSCPGQIHFRD